MVDNDLESEPPTTPNRAGGVWVHPAIGLTPAEITSGTANFPCPEMTCPMAAQLAPMGGEDEPTIDEYLSAVNVPGPDGVLQCHECGVVVVGLESHELVQQAREEHGDADPGEVPWVTRPGF